MLDISPYYLENMVLTMGSTLNPYVLGVVKILTIFMYLEMCLKYLKQTACTPEMIRFLS